MVVHNSTLEDIFIKIPTIKVEEFDALEETFLIDVEDLCDEYPDGVEQKTIVEYTCKDLCNGNEKSGYSHKQILQIQKSNRVKEVKKLLRLEHLNSEERENIDSIITDNADLFQLPDEPLNFVPDFYHKITTTDDQPVFTRQYRFPPIHKDEITKQVGELVKNNVISPSLSPYSSPLWIVPKKEDSHGNKRWRMVIDYRNLNEKTIGDAYPLPQINEILDQLGSAKYFSVFDLASGFHQIRVDPKDKHKTAFSTPFGHYEFNRMPFGLKNAPATFQRLMDRVLVGLQGIELFVYLDDIVIYAKSLSEHKTKFEKLAMRLRNANLHLQPDKCEFLRREVGYLGHVISDKGVKPDPKKIEALQHYPAPTTQKKIKQFLGLAGYYRRFIENFSGLSKPLTNLLKKGVPFKWTEAQQKSFDTLREALCKEPILEYPDFTKPFNVTTDASNYAIGGVLSQGEIGKDKPIAYASRTLNKHEINYSVIEKECLAIIYCVNHFRPYIYGRKFNLLTDHQPLVWLNSVKDPANRLVHWRLSLANYEYKIFYKPGSVNSNADALSRNPPETKTVHIMMHRPEKRKKLNSPNENPPESNDDSLSESNSSEHIFSPPRRRRVVTPVHCPLCHPPTRNNPQSESSSNEFIFSPPVRPKKKSIKEPLSSNLEIEISHSHKRKRKADLSPSLGGSRDDLIDPDESMLESSPSDNRAPADHNVQVQEREMSSHSLSQEGSRGDEDALGNRDDVNIIGERPEDIVVEPDLQSAVLNDDSPLESLGFCENDDINEGQKELELEEISLSDESEDETSLLLDPGARYQGTQEDSNYSIEGALSIREIRDNLSMQKGNKIVFITRQGLPIDSGAKELESINKLPKFQDITIFRAKVIKEKGCVIIALPILFHLKENISLDDLGETFESLRNVITEEHITSLNIAKTNLIGGLNWPDVKNLLVQTIRDQMIALTICKQMIRFPSEQERVEIIIEKHASAIGGHKGVNKTYKRIRENFYWENMKTQIQEFIAKCRNCQLKKLVRVKTKQPMVLTDTPGSSFDKISMDIVGPLPTTSSGNSYILTIQDLLTKYSVAVPLARTTSVDIADAFINRFICSHGAPKAILTDQGRNFLSSLIKSIAKKYRIKLYQTTAFHPQSNGSIERSHHVLAEYLKQFIDKNNEWDKLIELCMFSYNTSQHEGTKYTPFELVYGKLARLPSGHQHIEEQQDPTYSEYLEQLYDRIDTLQTHARENLIAAKEKSKHYYDRKINPQQFDVGDVVLMLKEPSKGKFSDQYTEPCEIIEILSGGNLKILYNGKPRIVHANKLRGTRLPLE